MPQVSMTPAMLMTFGLMPAAALSDAGGGGRRKLPRRRRAAIERHIEVLRRPAEPRKPRTDIGRELEMARLMLLELDALVYLLPAQDSRLVALYRAAYMDALRREDDEWILWMA